MFLSSKRVRRVSVIRICGIEQLRGDSVIRIALQWSLRYSGVCVIGEFAHTS